MIQEGEINNSGVYIEATQDGIVRLSFDETPSNIEGMYTTGLESCAAIIFVGDKGISLIHDTGRINEKTILTEKEWVGNLNWWTLVMHAKADAMYKAALPYKYAEKYPQGIFHETIKPLKKMNLPMKKYIAPEKCDSYTSEGGFVSISRQINIDVTKRPDNFKEPPNSTKRHLINILNNYFITWAYIPGDVQFDGVQFSDCSSLMLSLPEMNALAGLKKDVYGFGLIKGYAEKYEPQILQQLMTDERTGNRENEKVAILNLQTFMFFNEHKSWKSYPEKSKTPDRKGHDVRFFSEPSQQQRAQMKNFSDKLREAGFDAQVGNLNDKTFVTVDLTKSM